MISVQSNVSEQRYSPLEELPRELTWQLIEYAPEAVPDLRMTSSTLLSRVDEYALERSAIRIVDELRIRRNCDMTIFQQVNVKPTHSLVITIQVPTCKCSLFELRLKMHRVEALLKIAPEGMNNDSFVYEMKHNLDDNNDTLELLRKCIGKSIAKVSIEFCDNQTEFDAISKLLRGVNFGKLLFRLPWLSEFAINYLLQTISQQYTSVDLTLCVKEMHTSDPVKVLLDLSNLVESLHVNQMCVMGLDSRSARYFFGLNDFDWAPVILEMFARKLSKLYITNYFYRGYLSMQSAEVLRENLLRLGKEICFKTWCWSHNETAHVMNKHYVNVTQAFFTVKHLSRVHESFEIYYEPSEFSMESQPPHKRAKPATEEDDKKEVSPVPEEASNKQDTSNKEDLSKQEEPSRTEDSKEKAKEEPVLSPLERLPIEFAWKLIEYAPECVFKIRLASTSLQSLVDDYVHNGVTISLVSELGFTGSEDKHHAIAPPGLIYVNIFVRKQKAALFELSLKLRQPPMDFVDQIERETASSSSTAIDDSFKYQLEMDPLFNFHFMSYWEYLMKILDPKVNFVSFFGCSEEEFTSICSKLTIKFENMGVVMEQVSGNAIDHLIKIITASKVEHISLQVGDVTAADCAQVLLKLASLVRAIIIIQDPVASIDKAETYLFGVHDGDWASTIKEMFSKKMDKLYIENNNYEEYLSSDAAEDLMKNLPNTDKKIWFKASFFKEIDLTVSSTVNDHVIKVAPMSGQSEHRMLSIIHSTRLGEPENGDY